MTALLLLTTTALAVGAPEGLVSWWPANGSADDVIDENHGALDNVTYGPGMVGDAFLFDAGTGRVEIASSPSLMPGEGDFSVEAWVRTDTANVGVISSTRDTSTNGHIFYSRYGYLYAWVGSSRVESSAPNIADDAWHHVALTVDRDDVMTLYVDGAAVGTADLSMANLQVDVDGPFVIGQDSLSGYESSQYWAGSIDELAWYDAALPPPDIEAIFNAGADGKEACGDGVRSKDEECDGDDLGEQTCDDLGLGGGDLACDADCVLDTADCGATTGTTIGGTTGTTGGGTTGGSTTGGTTSGGSTTSGGTTAGSTGGTTGGGSEVTDTGDSDGKGGCGCASGPATVSALLGLLAIAAAGRRRS